MGTQKKLPKVTIKELGTIGPEGFSPSSDFQVGERVVCLTDNLGSLTVIKGTILTVVQSTEYNFFGPIVVFGPEYNDLSVQVNHPAQRHSFERFIGPDEKIQLLMDAFGFPDEAALKTFMGSK